MSPSISLAEFMRNTPLLMRAWVAGAVSTIALTLLMAPSLEGYNILALQFSFSQTQFVSLVEAMSPAAREGFGMHYRYDFLYPIAYGLWMSTTLAWLMKKTQASHWLNAIIYLPMFAALFDLAENSFIAPYALDFTQVTDHAVFWQSVCASMKYGLLAIGGITLLGLAGKWLMNGKTA